MKIALLHDSILPPKNYGGIERIVLILAQEYRRRGHEVLIVSRAGSQIKDFEHLAMPADFYSDSNYCWLPKNIDFLHSHQPLGPKPPIPFLVTIHGNGSPEERYYPNTNFLSQSHARNHSAKYFVYNGIDPEHYPFNENKQNYYVFLARTTWRVKNVKTAISWATDLGVRLEIMGGSGVSRGNIHYNGLVNEAEKLDLLKNARALIYPTNWDEPCAAAPLEALACGTPVVSSVNGCMPELVRPGTGICCESYEQMLEAPETLKSIQSKDCRAVIEKTFSLERMADDYLKLFERIRTQGELDHSPKYNFQKASVHWLFKPNFMNEIYFSLRGKI